MPGPLPLLGLRAFAEVGRSESVKDAARRLGVTPGAVSQQVKLLEARLGVALLERRNREVRLTAEGKRLFAAVAEPFDRIESAVEAIGRRRGAARAVLTVSTTSSFAATWLVPRLGGFTMLHKRVDVRIVTGPELVPVGAGAGSADVAIRHGWGDGRGWRRCPCCGRGLFRWEVRRCWQAGRRSACRRIA